MRLVAALVIFAVHAVASAKGPQAFPSPSQQFKYQANAYVVEPLRQGARQTWDRYAPAVKNGYHVGSGARNVYSAGTNFLRYRTAPLIVVTPKNYNPAFTSRANGSGRVY